MRPSDSQPDAPAAVPISLTIPAEQGLVRVARLTASGVAAWMRLSLEELEDLKLAISEACTDLIDSGCARGALTVRLVPMAEAVVVEVEGDTPPEGAPAQDDDEHGYALALMEAVMDGVEFVLAESGARLIRMTRRRTGSSNTDTDTLDNDDPLG